MSRWHRLCLAGAVVLAGLSLRLVPWGLPLAIHHYGGSVLWGAMLFLLVSALRPSRWRPKACIGLTLTLAVAIELVRLVHAPWLDAFRLELAGQLLLGRIFSPWNLPAYAVGIAAAVAVTEPEYLSGLRDRGGRSRPA